MFITIIMEQICFNSLPKDVYKIIIDKIIINSSMDDFKNYTLADKKSLLDDYVKTYIGQTVLNLHIKNYLSFIDDFATKNKVYMQKKFHEICSNLLSQNKNFYNELIDNIVNNSNFYNFNELEKLIIYDNLVGLMPFYMIHYPRTQYYHIIDRLLNIYNIRGKNQFRISFMIFIGKLRQDLKHSGISREKSNKIIIKIIKSFNWENKTNAL